MESRGRDTSFSPWEVEGGGSAGVGAPAPPKEGPVPLNDREPGQRTFSQYASFLVCSPVTIPRDLGIRKCRSRVLVDFDRVPVSVGTSSRRTAGLKKKT